MVTELVKISYLKDAVRHLTRFSTIPNLEGLSNEKLGRLAAQGAAKLPKVIVAGPKEVLGAQNFNSLLKLCKHKHSNYYVIYLVVRLRGRSN